MMDAHQHGDCMPCRGVHPPAILASTCLACSTAERRGIPAVCNNSNEWRGSVSGGYLASSAQSPTGSALQISATEPLHSLKITRRSSAVHSFILKLQWRCAALAHGGSSRGHLALEGVTPSSRALACSLVLSLPKQQTHAFK